jgi:L-fuculose-phosphate aldolase
VFLGDVGTIPYAAAFGDGCAISAAVSPRRPVALLENNGALVLGMSILDAFDRLEVLEATAEAVINTRPLGAVKVMEEGRIKELREAFGMG